MKLNQRFLVTLKLVTMFLLHSLLSLLVTQLFTVHFPNLETTPILIPIFGCWRLTKDVNDTVFVRSWPKMLLMPFLSSTFIQTEPLWLKYFLSTLSKISEPILDRSEKPKLSSFSNECILT